MNIRLNLLSEVRHDYGQSFATLNKSNSSEWRYLTRYTNILGRVFLGVFSIEFNSGHVTGKTPVLFYTTVPFSVIEAQHH